MLTLDQNTPEALRRTIVYGLGKIVRDNVLYRSLMELGGPQ